MAFCGSGGGGPWSEFTKGSVLVVPWKLLPILVTSFCVVFQPTEPIKRQPRSQCLSTLVHPVFGEVSRVFLVPLLVGDAEIADTNK